MQQFMEEIKRKDIKKRIKLFFQSTYGCPAIIFMLWFVLNVSSLASKHLDYQVTYPLVTNWKYYSLLLNERITS